MGPSFVSGAPRIHNEALPTARKIDFINHSLVCNGFLSPAHRPPSFFFFFFPFSFKATSKKKSFNKWHVTVVCKAAETNIKLMTVMGLSECQVCACV